MISLNKSSLILTIFLIYSVNCDEVFLWEKFVNISTPQFERTFLPKYIDFDVIRQNVSVECKLDIEQTLLGLRLRQNWAIALFNSWAKYPPSGLTQGTLTDFGDYDQCLSVSNEMIQPQYCLVDLSLPMPPLPVVHNLHHKSLVIPENYNYSAQISQYISNGSFYRHLETEGSVLYYMTLKLGICLPMSCTTKDIEAVATKHINPFGIDFKNVRCENKVSLKLNKIQNGAIIFLAFVVALSLVATVYDHHVGDHRQKLSFLLWFSPIRNVRSLISAKSENDDLSAIHGLRFITSVWIIVAHTLEWNSLNMYKDSFILKDRLSQLNLQLLFKGPYAVETFFYFSGLLTSYVGLNFSNGEKGNFGLIPFFVLRYLRLTPQLFAFLWLTSLLPVLFDGPIWKSYMENITDKCYANWWHNILYLQNMIDVKNMCALHTWFLSTDMQLHWMSLIPVIFLLRNRTQGMIVTGIFALVCVLVCCATVFINNLAPDLVITTKSDFQDRDGNLSDYALFYYKPWNHAIVFFIGFAFGTFISNSKTVRNVSYTKITQYCLWMVTLFAYLFVIFNTTPYLLGRPYEWAWSVLLFPLNRAIWALMLTLLLWLCITNNGGVIGKFFCWPGFRPLSRMTYSVYLTHGWIVWTTAGSRRDLIDIGHTHSVLILVGGVVVLTFIIGFVFTIIFESPVIQLLESFKKQRTHSICDLNGNYATPNLKMSLLEIKTTKSIKSSQL